MTDSTQPPLPAEISQWVLFHLAKEEFGVPAVCVQEIVRYPDVTHVPSMPKFVKGVINLRGKIVPIMDLRDRFEISGEAAPLTGRRIIVSLMGKDFVGLIVDSVSEVVGLAAQSISPVPAGLPKIDSEFLSGVGKLKDRLVVLLNLDKLLTDMEKKILSELKP